jgi:hypothetical protein
MGNHRALTTLLFAGIFICGLSVCAQEKVVWSHQEKPIVEQIRGLRKLDDSVRARTTKDLALQIRQLPVVPNKLRLAGALANLSTEGDFGRDTLQEVTTTLAQALHEQPPAGKPGEPDEQYVELASLVRYEHMSAESDNPSSRRQGLGWRPMMPSARRLTSRSRISKESPGICEA